MNEHKHFFVCVFVSPVSFVYLSVCSLVRSFVRSLVRAFVCGRRRRRNGLASGGRADEGGN